MYSVSKSISCPLPTSSLCVANGGHFLTCASIAKVFMNVRELLVATDSYGQELLFVAFYLLSWAWVAADVSMMRLQHTFGVGNPKAIMSCFINTSANTILVQLLPTRLCPRLTFISPPSLSLRQQTQTYHSHHPNIISANIKKYDRCTKQNEAAGWCALCYRHILQLH